MSNIIILYLPTANQRMLPFPPLGIAVLNGYLRRHGVEVCIDDIEMKYWEKDIITIPVLRKIVRFLPNRYNNPKQIFLNKQAVDEYLDKSILRPNIEKILYEWESLTNRPINSFTHIGFSVMSFSQLSTSLCFAKYIKDKYGLYTIMGGSLFTARMVGLFRKYRFIDYYIIGEGEKPLFQLLQGDALRSIKGLVYRENNNIRINSPEYKYEQDLTPDFTGLPFQLYRKNGVLIIPYETSKGCRNNCAFCVTGKKPLYFKDIETVVDDMIRIKTQYRTPYFFLVDNAINLHREYSVRLCEHLIRRKAGIIWSAYYIPEDAPLSYFRLLREAGCVQLRWGVESFSETILHKMNKNIDPKHIPNALKKAHDAGIWNHLLLMVGHPEERFRYIIKTMILLLRCRRFFKSAVISPFILSRIDYLTSKHGYIKYYDTSRMGSRHIHGLLYRYYKDPFLSLKYRLIKYALYGCCIRYIGNFSRYKDDIKRGQFLYGVFEKYLLSKNTCDYNTVTVGI